MWRLNKSGWWFIRVGLKNLKIICVGDENYLIFRIAWLVDTKFSSVSRTCYPGVFYFIVVTVYFDTNLNEF